MTDDDWDRTLAINLQAPIHLIHKLLTVLQSQDEAHVVNICSMFGLYACRHAAAYVATKHAMVGLTRSLRYDYAGTGLGASAICPGFVHGTALFDDIKRTPPKWICCTPQCVAQRTIKAIRGNHAIVVTTALARVLWWANRLSPWLVDAVLRMGWGASRRRRRRQARSNTT
jgi:3-oxoacyl-[acyl-carrier protein] reductase